MAASDSFTRVFVWCNPRSMSTAFTKFMSGIEGVELWHQPYSAAWENETLLNPAFKPDCPKMRRLKEVYHAHNMPWFSKYPKGTLQDQALFSYPWVQQQLEDAPSSGKYVVCKEMIYSISKRKEYLPKGNYRHTFLIRNPRKVYPSFKVFVANDYIQADDINKVNILTDMPIYEPDKFFKDTYELYKIAEAQGNHPIVIDADDVVSQPEIIVPKYFNLLGLPWDEKLLKWSSNKDDIPSWRGAFEFYISGAHPQQVGFKNALASTKFTPQGNSEKYSCYISPDVEQCIAESMEYFDLLHAARLRP